MDKEKEIYLGIDLGTMYSCEGILKNGNVIIFTEKGSDNRIIPSMVCFKDDRLYESKRLIGLKYETPHVQKDIELMKLLKIIEELKTKKPKYVIKGNDEEKVFFPEDVSSMILEYL